MSASASVDNFNLILNSSCINEGKYELYMTCTVTVAAVKGKGEG
jgi:hypothetical protein